LSLIDRGFSAKNNYEDAKRTWQGQLGVMGDSHDAGFLLKNHTGEKSRMKKKLGNE